MLIISILSLLLFCILLCLFFVYRRGIYLRAWMAEQLYHSKEHLDLALSASRIGMWDWDIKKDLISWDENTQKLVGRKDGLKLDDFVQSIHPRDRDRFRKEIELSLAGEAEYETTLHVMRPDGSVAIQAARGKVYRDAQGKPVRMTGAVWDISNEKKAEEAVRRSEINYRGMIESSADGILILEQRQGTILFMNRAAAKLFDQSIPDMMGTQFGFPITSDKISEINLFLKSGKKRIVELHVAGTQWEEKSAYLVSLRDITARKELEAQFVQAQKMEAVGQLSGGIAHDFNNLLTVINGYSEIYHSRLAPGDPLRGPFEEILKAGIRAKNLTAQILAFSRRQVFAPKIIDLNAVILDLNKMLKRLLGEDLELLLNPGDDLWAVKADPSQMEQVLMNLAVNARDAMPAGGKLTLETRNMKFQAEKNSKIPAGDYVKLSVTDTGVGMTPEVKARIFEPFFTTKEMGKGTGLGLATCMTILNQSGAHLEVLSELGKGTAFEIYFPRSAQKPEPLISQKPADALPKGSETILLVEDDAAVRKLVSDILSRQGYTIVEAENGETALHLAKDQKEIHLTIADVVMPRMNGAEYVEQIKFSRPGLKVLFISGYTDEQALRYGVEVAQNNFLQKPFTPPALIMKVRQVLDQKS